MRQRETGEISTELARRSRRVRVLGQLLDSSIPIPGTNRTIGLDAVIGLIPGAGDVVGGLLSGYIILEAARAQVPTMTLVRMLANVGIDTLVGVMPVLGDLFDHAAGLVRLSVSGDVRLSENADEAAVLLDYGQPAHLVL